MVISLALCVCDSIARRIRFLIGLESRSCCVVLYYHAIEPGQAAGFAQQMTELVRWTKPISATHTGSFCDGNHYAAVTFDDGFESVIKNALPVLESRGIPSLIFVPTGCLGKRPPWIKSPEMPAYRETVMTAEQLRALKTHSLVTVGSHSVNHPNFVKLEEGDARREFQDSKAALERILDQEIEVFSFPHGAYSARLVQWAREAGYKRVFAISPSQTLNSVGHFVVGRVLADPRDWTLEFRAKLLGGYRWLCWVSAFKAALRGDAPSHGGMSV